MGSRQSFQTRDHKKAMETMQDAVFRNGFNVIIVRFGLGKPHTGGWFLNFLKPSSHIAAYIAPDFATTPESYLILCIQFKLDPTDNKHRMLNTLKHYLHSFHLRNKPAAIIVDEALDLMIDTLSELQILMNFARDAFSVVTLILSKGSRQHDPEQEEAG